MNKPLSLEDYKFKTMGLLRTNQHVVVDAQPNINHVHNTYIAPESTEYRKPQTNIPPASLTYHVNMVPYSAPLVYEDQQKRVSEFMKDGI
jgi:hypothetical protein